MPLHNRPSKLRITPTTKSVKVRPQNRDELRYIIEQEIENQGLDADLNFIDTSEITDMSNLFHDLTIRNIKIDQWDVSKVEDMNHMFIDQEEFNCDLSNWDVRNVYDMDWMFCDCKKFKCSLSRWEPCVTHIHWTVFEGCSLITMDLRPRIL